ncbi:MAG: type II toxin-antitoxin system VapC family toxin [Candidatus Woesearchaeota archaeon]
MKVYVDTCIYLDYIQKRNDKLRPLGDFAFEFFSRGWNCKFKLVFSNLNLEELEFNLSNKEYEEILEEFKSLGKLIEVKYSEEEFQESRKDTHKNDKLHTLIAEREGCKYLVTRNISDFNSSTLEIVYPEYV